MSSRGTFRATLILLFAAASSLSIAASGRCLRAEVSAPMVFPDGTAHPAGTLTLCVTDYSPVASYHRVSVNGRAMGLLFSRRKLAEAGDAKGPHILFDKIASGELRLVGYTLPEDREIRSYLLQGEPGGLPQRKRISAKDAPESVE